jgi:hypothetical protein
MADKANHEEPKEEEATVGMRASVKTHLQLSSSAKAAQDNRRRINDEKALRLLNEAVQQGLERENQQSSNRGSNQ